MSTLVYSQSKHRFIISVYIHANAHTYLRLCSHTIKPAARSSRDAKWRITGHPPLAGLWLMDMSLFPRMLLVFKKKIQIEALITTTWYTSYHSWNMIYGVFMIAYTQNQKPVCTTRKSFCSCMGKRFYNVYTLIRLMWHNIFYINCLGLGLFILFK